MYSCSWTPFGEGECTTKSILYNRKLLVLLYDSSSLYIVVGLPLYDTYYGTSRMRGLEAGTTGAESQGMKTTGAGERKCA